MQSALLSVKIQGDNRKRLIKADVKVASVQERRDEAGASAFGNRPRCMKSGVQCMEMQLRFSSHRAISVPVCLPMN